MRYTEKPLYEITILSDLPTGLLFTWRIENLIFERDSLCQFFLSQLFTTGLADTLALTGERDHPWLDSSRALSRVDAERHRVRDEMHQHDEIGRPRTHFYITCTSLTA